MPIINSIITWAMKKRIHQMELFKKHPIDVQHEQLFKFLAKAKDTEWGKKYDYASIKTYNDFKERVPVSTYEQLNPHFERIMQGEKDILWPGKIKWFSKSSGTTNARSKYIPVTPEALEDCHYKAGKDMLSIYVNNFPSTNLFAGKGLSIGGSLGDSPLGTHSRAGDVSAVIMYNLPFWAQIIRTPKLKTALMDKWEDKIEQMAIETSKANVTSFAGVPTWTIVLIERILEMTGASNITEIWPNLECFFHGAVSFEPYRQLFKDLIPKDNMNYLETYSASEGFFGIQDQPGVYEMLLMLDNGIFYEFIPIEEFGSEHPKTIALEDVEIGKNYALVISSNAGLWRYIIGDTVRFTSKEPFRIKISGRTKHFINAFGEEVIVENADSGIATACATTGAKIDNYTAAPLYFGEGKSAGHQWLIEFEVEPNDLRLFTETLDKKIREINSDYDAKRYQDIALKMPDVKILPKGTFYKWMEKRGKLGGQNKVPRLSNTREYVDDILDMLNKKGA